MFEPSDSQEAKDFIKLGFEVSERFDAPVMVRSVTRISHAKGVVELEEPMVPPVSIEIRKQTEKFTMLPSFASIRHTAIEGRLLKLEEFAEQFPGNRMEISDPTIDSLPQEFPINIRKRSSRIIHILSWVWCGRSLKS